MKKILKIFNPIIWFINFFMYSAHMDMYKNFKEYVPYNFDNDIKYF